MYFKKCKNFNLLKVKTENRNFNSKYEQNLNKI